MLLRHYGIPYHSTLGMKTPLPHSRNTSKHISSKKPLTCKMHEIVSYCILITALYQMLCCVMLYLVNLPHKKLQWLLNYDQFSVTIVGRAGADSSDHGL